MGDLPPAGDPPRSFWDAAATTSEPLTAETLIAGMAALKRKADWEWAHPHGIDPENPHIIGPKTHARLERDGKGWALCGTCGWFYYEPLSRNE